MGIDAEPLRFQCCFCGTGILRESPRQIVLPLEGDAAQHLYAHEACLRQALHASVPLEERAGNG
jgi:hypothetical protein